MSIATIDDFVSSVANNDTVKLLAFHTSHTNAPSKTPFNINSTDATGDTAIEVAVTTSNHKMLKLLLERFKCDPNVSGTKRNQTPLRLAARKNDFKSCQLLCQFGADVNATKPKLLSAATSGNDDGDEEEGKASAAKKPNDEDEDGWTPLHVAIFGMKKDTINFFLLKDLNSNNNNNNNSNNQVRMKINFFIRTKREGATVLHFASAQGLHQVVGDILSAINDQQGKAEKNCDDNSNNNTRDINGDTCLHSALHYRMSKSLGGRYSPPEHPQWSIAMTLALLGHVDPSIKNDSGEAATHYLEKELPSFAQVLALLFEIGLMTSSNAVAATTTIKNQVVVYEEITRVCESANAADLRNYIRSLTNGNGDELESTTAEKIDLLFGAVQSLEKQRSEKNEKAKAAHLAAASKAKREKEQGQDDAKQGAENYNKTIDPHGMGIDIKNLKPGDDPSHGECPFLVMRSNASKLRAKQQQENGQTTGDEFSKQDLIVSSLVSFLVGVVVGGVVISSYIKKK